MLADRCFQLLLGYVPVLALEREVVEDDAVSVRAVPGRLAGGGFAGGWVHFAGGGGGESEGGQEGEEEPEGRHGCFSGGWEWWSFGGGLGMDEGEGEERNEVGVVFGMVGKGGCG